MSTVLDPPVTHPPHPRVAPAIEVAAQLLGKLAPDHPVLFTGVTWDEYVWLREQRDERSGNTRLTFDRGRLELMVTSFRHDRLSRLLALCLWGIAEALDVRVMTAGGTTLSDEELQRGLQPDECFYIQNLERVRFLEEIDLTLHPPPDLAVEVDHTNSSIPKLPLYAALGVPEVWRATGGVVTILVRQPDETYRAQANSHAFPLIPADGLSRMLYGHTGLDDITFLKNVRNWATTLIPSA